MDWERGCISISGSPADSRTSLVEVIERLAKIYLDGCVTLMSQRLSVRRVLYFQGRV